MVKGKQEEPEPQPQVRPDPPPISFDIDSMVEQKVTAVMDRILKPFADQLTKSITDQVKEQLEPVLQNVQPGAPSQANGSAPVNAIPQDLATLIPELIKAFRGGGSGDNKQAVFTQLNQLNETLGLVRGIFLNSHQESLNLGAQLYGKALEGFYRAGGANEYAEKIAEETRRAFPIPMPQSNPSTPSPSVSAEITRLSQ